MKLIFAYTKNQKVKVKAIGKTLSLLTLLVSISKCLAEQIGSLTVEQSQKSFRPYKACIFLSNFACGYCVILRDVL